MIDLSNPVVMIAVLIMPMIAAIVFHEVAHGWAARALGDPTASNLGRLSLNPLKHVDPFGTLILPGMLMLAGWPVFGYAKPVPVVKQRLRDPRRDMMLVAAAGPSSNLVMAAIGAVALGLISPGITPYLFDIDMFNEALGQFGLLQGFVTANLYVFVSLNVFLAIFNLLPIPPFDGGHIIEGLLPRDLARKYGAMHQKALLIMILLLVVLPLISPSLNVVRWLIYPPVAWLTDHYLQLAQAIAGG